MKINLKKLLLISSAVLFVSVGLFFAQSALAAPLDLGLQPLEATGLGHADIRIIIANIIKVALGLLGILAVGLVLYAGYEWMTSGGNEEQIGAAKKILLNAVIGLAIILSAYSIVAFVMTKLVEATGGASPDAKCQAQQAAGGLSCDGDCPPCGDCPPGVDCSITESFHIDQKPSGGDVCVSNYYPIIVFNKNVDLDSLNHLGANNHPDNIQVVRVSDSAVVDGTWHYQGGNYREVYFTSPNACVGVDSFCLQPKTNYKLIFVKPGNIKTKTGVQSLTCSGAYNCSDVSFTTGEKVDTQPPQINVKFPQDGDGLDQNSTVGVVVNYKDDVGLQTLNLNVDNNFIDSVKPEKNCEPTGELVVNWKAFKFSLGKHNLNLVGADWANNKGSQNLSVNLKPTHCYNNKLDQDLGEKFSFPSPTGDCGGECGACAGDVCQQNSDCASGYCEIPQGQSTGKCVDKTRIDYFSLDNGAPGDYVSVFGKYFGQNPGHVYFSTSTGNNWVEAMPVNCGGNFKYWTDNQIIVSVPTGTAAVGPLKVVTQTGGANGTDTTGDNWGAKSDFTITDKSHPGICSINPNGGYEGMAFKVSGKGFGKLSELNIATDGIFFQGNNTKIVNWSENFIDSFAPVGLGNGDFTVQAKKNGLYSNGIKFVISGANPNGPIITGLSAVNTALGDYLVIYGKNFGSQTGSVIFNKDGNKNSPDINGVLDDFPSQCKDAIWSDTKILVKIPKNNIDLNTDFSVRVKLPDNITLSPFDKSFVIHTVAGSAKPGVCLIDPSSGPVPFKDPTVLNIYGDNLQNVNVAYFWKLGAHLDDLKSLSSAPVAADLKDPSKHVTVQPGGDVISGSMLVVSNDNKQSNVTQFSVFDCTKNNNSCADGTQQCCTVGTQNGMCISQNSTCAGVKRSAGYVWLFSTGGIANIPQVVERCNADTEAGKFIPTPSPSTLWNTGGSTDANNVCQTALVTVEFNGALDQNTVNANTVKLFSCGSVDGNQCKNPKQIDNNLIDPGSYKLQISSNNPGGLKKFQFLSIGLKDNQKWTSSTWYQVVLSDTVKSEPFKDKYNQDIQFNLAATKPCGNGTAYCFVFRTGVGDCKLKQVIVTPSQFWTNVLEEPIRYRTAGGDAFDLTYDGNGLSDQHCIMMNVNGFAWDWSPVATTYVKRLSMFGPNNRLSQFGAEANTVGIGLDNNSVSINATAATTTNGVVVSKTGTSTLTIDLSNPQVVDYEPKCLEACTDALVSATFNVSMSSVNLDSAVKLYKCNDENCLSVTPILGVTPAIDNKSINDHRWLKIFNNILGGKNLEPNTLYEVVLSSATSTPNVKKGDQLWSLANATLPMSFSKPFNQEFSWRFRTKKEACAVDRVEVTPKIFTAQKLNDKAVFTAQPYSAPDACSANGQKLNPFKSNWSWSSSDLQVATVQSFTTKGHNPYCSSNCLLKGSDIASGGPSANYPVCGNDKIEAGEDCLEPDKTNNCSLSCLNITKTKKGSQINTASQDVEASICGNGFVGVDEDCDLGIAPSPTATSSAMFCGSNCLHLGTPLSSAWCQKHQADRGGFSVDQFDQACSQALSRCGDGVEDFNEDKGCDTGKGTHDIACDDHCLYLIRCNVGEVGCSPSGQKQGSSLLYPTPSVCGDGQAGIGEDATCDDVNNFTAPIKSLVDPWTLATGQGGGIPIGEPPVQSSNITGTTNNKSGVGKYQVECGWQSDFECSSKYGDPNRGVGDDSCCYSRPQLTKVYPGNVAAPVNNICINTYIEADFDSVIDASTLSGNLLLAKNDDKSNACAVGTQQIDSALVAEIGNVQNLAWYQKVWHKVVAFVKNIFGSNVAQANVWCVGGDLATPSVVPDGQGGSKIVLQLNQVLSTSTKYAVILKSGIKDIKGVRIRDGINKPLGWQFITGNAICEISTVSVDPDHYSFNVANTTTTLSAQAHSQNNQLIVPVSGYSWNYNWGPKVNDFVTVEITTSSINKIVSQNRNGEIDVFATAKITENVFTKKVGLVGTGRSHIIVFLCENPWPPLSQKVNNTGPFSIFPYEDKIDNNDNFNIAQNIFDNNPIPPSQVVNAGYFNFRTYYCADSGASGSVVDDLPYLKPAVQVASTTLGSGSFVTSSIIINTTVPDKSTCASDPTVMCAVDNDCTKYTLHMFGGQQEFISGKTGMCVPQNSSSIYYYFDTKNHPVTCNVVQDCLDSIVVDQAFANFYNNLGPTKSMNCNGIFNYSPTKALSTCVTNTKVVSSNTIQSLAKPFNALKRFFFTNAKNNDAIGVQIFSNPNHLSARQWFELDKKYGGQGFTAQSGLQDMQVDGYDAVSDGNNIYVNALNFTPSAPNVGNLYTNTYLFSINPNSNDETKKVFEQFVKNLKFNINLTNDKRCVVPGDGPAADAAVCESDFDCVSTSTVGQVCSAQKDKLQRDFKRLKDMGQIFDSLDNYSKSTSGTYPGLKAGTYLTGQTVSTWPSWSVLGNALGAALPADPINKLGVGGTCASSTGVFCVNDNDCVGQDPVGQKCVLHDSTTGWSTENQRFSFACPPDSLAYRYVATSTSSTAPGADSYLIKMNWEIIGLKNQGLNISNRISLFNDFIGDLTKFDLDSLNGICNQSKEISSLVVGACGDGTVGKNEQCDPPGSVNWKLSDCSVQGVKATTTLHGDICSDGKIGVPACTWKKDATSTTCGAKLSKCNNGIVEIGEACDDGALNGQYGHCNNSCTGFTSGCGDGTVDKVNEVCDTKADNYFGWCTDGFVAFTELGNGTSPNDAFCNYTANSPFASNDGKLFGLNLSKNKYGLTKTASCAADCQNYGPYCGDGVVQEQFGEECEGDQSCSLGAISGNRFCSNECKWKNNSAIVYYKFDDVWVSHGSSVPGGKSYIPNSATTTGSATTDFKAYCTGDASQGCPLAVPSVDVSKKQAMYFNGTSNYFIIDHKSAFDLNELTLAVWINVDPKSSDGYHAILSKQDDKVESNNRDYNFYIVKNGGKVNTLHLYSGPPPASTSSLIFGVNAVPVDFSVGEWHFVAVTVDSARNIKYYVDKELKGVGLVNGNVNVKANNPYKIWIGRADNYFQGSMDELQMYGRVLSEGEIKDLYSNSANFCELNVVPAAVKETGCGNGKVEGNEVCDKGVQNGIACVSSYNKACTYCSADCKNVIQVNATGYCGDGVINGPEKCESANGVLYSSATSTGTGLNGFGTELTLTPPFNGYIVLDCNNEFNTSFNVSSSYWYKQLLSGNSDAKNYLVGKVGSKACADNCGIDSNLPVQDNCVACGLKDNGVSISGSIINVLDPNNPNQLIAFGADANGDQQRGTLDLVYAPSNAASISLGKYSVGYKYMDEGNDMRNYKLAPGWGSDQNEIAKIESNPVCSDKTFDKLEGKHYQLAINADHSNEHIIDFPVFGATSPDVYNLVLSPVIALNQVNKGSNVVTVARPNDVRIVVSWVGKDQGEFVGGFLRADHLPTIYQPGAADGIGIDYFNKAPSNDGIWFHGLGAGNTSNEMAYTIDTSQMTTDYSFYVKMSATSTGISPGAVDAKLKVDIYAPEIKHAGEDDAVYRHFARPVKTFYFVQAAQSADPDSQYWHVFNVLKDSSQAAEYASHFYVGKQYNSVRKVIKSQY